MGSKCIHLRENFTTPSSNGGEKTRPEISSWVNCITRIEAHGEANDKNAESHREGLKTLGNRVVVGVHNGQDADNQRCCAYHLERWLYLWFKYKYIKDITHNTFIIHYETP